MSLFLNFEKVCIERNGSINDTKGQIFFLDLFKLNLLQILEPAHTKYLLDADIDDDDTVGAK